MTNTKLGRTAEQRKGKKGEARAKREKRRMRRKRVVPPVFHFETLQR